MAANPLPTPASIGDLVSMLVGKKVKVVTCPPVPVANARGLATYVDETGKVAFVALTDMAFLAGVGAALAMIPPAVAGEAIKSGKPAGPLLDNAQEVMNIAASLFNDADGKGVHVKFQRLVVLAPPLPPEIAKWAIKPPGRLDVELQMPPYVNGKLTLLGVA